MTSVLIAIIIMLVVRLVYLEFQKADQEYSLSEYRLLIMEWYNYLSTKKYGDDFRLWKQELEKDE